MSKTEAIFAAAQADDVTGLLSLLSAKPGFEWRNESGETVLLYSVYRGRRKCVEALGSRNGLTLHEAAAIGNVERLRECLATAPWTIQALSADGWPALHLSAYFGRDDAVLALLELGADARQWARASESNLAIHAACAGKRIGRSAFARLVVATGDPNVTPKHGYTALMEASMNGFADAVEVLLAAGADTTLRHHEKNMTAAEFAEAQGHVALAKRLR